MSAKKGPASLVIDASVLLAFYLSAEPYKARALALLADVAAGLVRLVIPTLAFYEVLNALSCAVRGLKTGQALSMEDALEILKAMAGLDLEEQQVKGLEQHILRISQNVSVNGLRCGLSRPGRGQRTPSHHRGQKAI